MDSQENKIRKIVLERLGLCRVCHREHQGGDVRVISQKPDVWMMVVECPDCHSRSFVAAVVDEKQADDAKIALRRLAGENLGMPSAEAEVHQIDDTTLLEAESQPISDSDVEDMHDFLQTFDGNFNRLFTQ